MCNYKNIVLKFNTSFKNCHVKSSDIRVILYPYPQHTLVLDLDSALIMEVFPQQPTLS